MIVALLALVAVVLAFESLRKPKQSRWLASLNGRPPLPPGPPPVPFLGNVLGLNKDAPYLTYTAWSKTYGDIVYMRMLGRAMIVLNSEEVAIDLLEKRSQKYSDRLVVPLAELVGWEWAISAAPYGPRFRLHRRLLHRVFHAKAALAYRPAQLKRAYEMLTRLLDDPTHYTAHFTTFSASVVTAVTYGYDMKGGETFVTSMQCAVDISVRALTPGVAALCNSFPSVVKAVPTWFPGMGFMKEAAECRRLTSEAVNMPYAWVKQRIEEGSAVSSMVTDAITRYHLYDDTRQPELVQAVKESAGTLYGASVDTTNSILLMFVYLMMNYPQIQSRAQREIDHVVGQQRLPDFGDRTSLPYVDAILRETMRWRPVTPAGVPHVTSEDDVYEGYYIPRGAMIMPNAMSHNEKKYQNPHAFILERFLRADGTLNDDNIPWVFGFGRRVCPGRHVADASLWCAMVSMLVFFTVEKMEGSEDVKWSKGLRTHPLPFPCNFVPRDRNMDPRKLASLICASSVDL